MTYLEILGGAPGTPCSVYLVTDHRRYLFNAGEGIQRFCTSHKVRLVKLSDIFISRLSISQLGGVPGLFLTLSDIGISDRVMVHGPGNLNSIIAATRLFASHATAILQTNEIDTSSSSIFPIFHDDNISVRALPIRPEHSRKRRSEDIPFPDPDLELLQSSNANDVPVVVYIIRLSDTPGKFDAAKGRALGMKPGPDFARLVLGEQITLDDGRVINPEDVVGPSRPGQVFAIVDCPSDAYIPGLSLLNSIPDLMLIVHLSPRTERYRQWMQSFPARVQHMASGDLSRTAAIATFASSAAHQVMMNRISSESFPICPWSADGESDVEMAPPLTKFVFAPHKNCGIDRSETNNQLDIRQLEAHMESIPELSVAIATAHQAQRSLPVAPSMSPTLTFLGTGAAAPSKYRSSSAIDLLIPSYGVRLLIDCGEGALGQMHRIIPEKEFPSYMASLRVVWISHKHADHHVGLLNVLRSRRQHTANDVTVIAPSTVLEWMRSFVANADDDIRCHLVDCRDALASTILSPFGITCLQSVPVLHCSNSFGLVLDHCDGWRFVYSGDTRPCQALIDAGSNATVLVHEATFEDDLQDEAILKKHCTTKEALDVGRQMNAAETILTHFSQRYPKIPTATTVAAASSCVAFDLMRIQFGRLAILPSLSIALDLLFSRHLPSSS
uniref:ribonuclease Z n=1 Tax=Spongospora subterranea TaxID=70186 RepID=A0A0H5QW55_9EUKA|eukprot:CRZ06155.1 hypothetical protein [Spongospora subterranea]